MSENKKTAKRIVGLSVAAMCMFSAVRLVPFSPVETEAADVLTAFEITENMKIGWVNFGIPISRYCGFRNFFVYLQPK